MVKTSPRVEKTTSQTSIFINLALDMSWRLAFVILVPIIGGYELDQWLNTTPLLTIVGFMIAMFGMGLVFWRTLQVANKMPVPKKESKK